MATNDQRRICRFCLNLDGEFETELSQHQVWDEYVADKYQWILERALRGTWVADMASLEVWDVDE